MSNLPKATVRFPNGETHTTHIVTQTNRFIVTTFGTFVQEMESWKFICDYAITLEPIKLPTLK